MKSFLSQTTWRLCLITLTLCTILSSCVQSNNCPVISSLEAEKDLVAPFDTCEIKCVAFDANGDNLTYDWSATGGGFSGVGSVATWTAPNNCGSYVVTVVVADGRGGKVSEDLKITVKKPG